tara:strand:+ start:100 stop:297 length:198 start_codon:yes stop_codon:yes gene_type:complete
MGAFKDIQTEAEEKAADPVFRLAVILIMEELLKSMVNGLATAFTEIFATRVELRDFVWKKEKDVT